MLLPATPPPTPYTLSLHDALPICFLEVNRPNVLLLTWKEAEDDQGTILRFLEIGGEAGPAEITIPLLKVESAWRCNRSEEHTSELQSPMYLVCRLLLEKKNIQ